MTAVSAERFRSVVADRLGLSFDDAKLPMLIEAVQRRAHATRQPVDAYLTQLETDASGGELGAVASELTVTETYFFRHMDQFRAFAEIALPDRVRARGGFKMLRLLSAGCASGEEPYSLAMLVRDARLPPSWRVSIRGVDVNAAALQRAARGRFSQWSLRETPADVRETWFRAEGRDVVLDDAIRGAVEFDERNLAADAFDLWPAAAYDVIFCRNVLMYFTPEHAQALVARMTRALAPGGYLFLGHAETLRGLSQHFQLCHTHGTFYYQRRDELQPSPSGNRAAAVPPAAAETALAAIVDDADTWVDVIQRATMRIEALTQAQPRASATRSAPRSELGLAHDLLRQERFGEALELVLRLPSESRSHPDVLLLQALLLAHAGRLTAAESACRELLARDDLNAGAHYVLALCREGAGDRRSAEEHDQVAAYLDPLFAMPRLHLGLLARRAGHRDAARRELGQAIVLLQREDASRLLFFGGGFNRETLIALCHAELEAMR